jgi:outer membrane protein OmpA-like peptidoglycan-associated protein
MQKLFILIFFSGLFGCIQTLNAQVPLQEDAIVVKNEPFVNSEDLEFSPTFFEDGIVFISTKIADPNFQIKDKKIGKNIMSIFKATRNDEGVLKKPEVFATELLSDGHEGPIAFDRNNEKLFFSRNQDAKGKFDIRKMDIYVAERKGDGWGNIKSLPFSDSNFDDCHPTISVENDAIYFSSDREGGQGGMDIWMSRRIGNEWSDPVNLGPEINGKGNELFPFVHADGTLYFASTSFGGEGGLDLFYAIPSGAGWTIPLNMGKPFNSEKDDFGFIVDRDNKNGYFSSNRKGGFGEDDIYSFFILSDGPGVVKKPKKEIAVDVKDKESGEILEDAVISYIDLDGYTLGEAMNGKDGDGGLLSLEEGGDGFTYRMNFGGSSRLAKDSTGRVIVPTGNTVLKVEKKGYQPQYITVTEEIFENGLQIEMEPAIDCMNFIATVYGEDRISKQAGANVIVTDLATGEQIELVTDASGEVIYCLPCDKVFNVIASRNGIVTSANTIKSQPCSASEALETALFLEGSGQILVEGTVIQLPNIYFNFNDATLRPDARPDLDALVSLLEIYPDMIIELASHTDSRGTKSFNLELSQRRSENSRAYLLENGIAPDRVVPVGYGETQLSNRCVDGVSCTEEEHQENRRTEVIIRKLGNPVEVPEEPTYAGNFQEQGNEADGLEGKSDEPGTLDEGTSDTDNNSTITQDDFLVVAGTFKNVVYAQMRLTELQNIGYTDAKIVQFDDSPYQSVVVGTYSEVPIAENIIRTLKSDHNIEAYLRKQAENVVE